MARPPQHRKTSPTPTPSTPPIDNTAATPVAGPVFAQPKPTADPTRFSINHPSDDAAYKTIDALNAQHKLGPIPFPAPRGGVEPVLTLAQVLGKGGDDAVKAIAKSGQLVFHAVGDTGSVSGPENISKVADKMVADFDEEATQNVPRFFFHLGDVIYNFGEMQYYYDQFYEPYREYAAPILAIAGNHDGMVAPGTTAVTLAAFLENFCASEFEIRPEAGGLSRTAQIQPGVFFTFEAPLVRIIALYSNVLEDPGVIASKELGNSQLDFLKAALTRAKKFTGRAEFWRTIIPPIQSATTTGGAKRCWRRSTRFARRRASGRMPSSPGMRTIISALPAFIRRCKFPTSSQAMAATPSPRSSVSRKRAVRPWRRPAPPRRTAPRVM